MTSAKKPSKSSQKGVPTGLLAMKIARDGGAMP